MDREPLLPITVRFAPDVYEAIREIASANGTSQAEIIRMAVAGNLARYLGDIRYIDPEQGEEVKRRVAQLIDAVSGIRNELNRIGVNLNQIARWMNTLAKYGDGDVGDGEAGDGEVEYGSVFLTGIKLDMLMYRYEQATKEVAEICRILG